MEYLQHVPLKWVGKITKKFKAQFTLRNNTSHSKMFMSQSRIHGEGEKYVLFISKFQLKSKEFQT